MFIVINVFVALSYILLVQWILSGWKNTSSFTVDSDYVSSIPVTVIVAARNEEENIENLLDAVSKQDFPKKLLHIIVVDDQSTDNTLQIVKDYSEVPVTVLSTENTQGGKKDAISLAMSMVKTGIVLCTDADCTPKESWIKYMTAYYDKYRPKFIAGPIVYKVDDSVIQRFQYLDGVGNMAVTANGIKTKKYYMANGANMLFESSLFRELKGYSSDMVASGDDMMLIQNAAIHYPDKIRFVKANEAIVETKAERSLKELIIQRKRWASKSKHYADKGIIVVQALVFLMVAAILMNLLLIPIFGSLAFVSLAVMVVVKVVVDFYFLSHLTHYFGNAGPMKSFISASVWFLGYILWAGYSAIVPSPYEWRDRVVK